MLNAKPGMVKPVRTKNGWMFYIVVNGEKVVFPVIPNMSAGQVKELMRRTVSALNSI